MALMRTLRIGRPGGAMARTCIAVATIGAFAVMMPLLSGCGKSGDDNYFNKADSLIERLNAEMKRTAEAGIKIDSVKRKIGALNRKIDTLNKKSAGYRKENRRIGAELRVARAARDSECTVYLAKKITEKRMKHDMDSIFAHEGSLDKESRQNSEKILKNNEEIKKIRNEIKALTAEVDSLNGQPGRNPRKVQKHGISHHHAPAHPKRHSAPFKYKH